RYRGHARGRGESGGGGSECAGPAGAEHWNALHHGGEAMSQTMRQAMSLRRQVQPVNLGDRPANRGVCPTGAWLLLALVLAPAAHAQFELFLVEGSTERAAPPVYDFGSLYADETASAHFRLRNTS